MSILPFMSWPALAANAVSPLPFNLHPARLVRLDLVILRGRGDQLAALDTGVVRSGPASHPEDAAHDQTDGGKTDHDESDQLGDGRTIAAIVILVDRFQPGQAIVIGASRSLSGPNVAHQCISSAAATPITARPLRIVCLIARPSSRRARVSSGLCANKKRREGSSLPRFHRAWNAAAKSLR
jgi:hypothetical protein